MHFGYNCKLLLPFQDKCRKLVHDYQKREDLVEEKWIGLQDSLIYQNLTINEMILQIKTGKIKVKRQQDGKPIFGITSAWRFDNCALANAGGQCLDFTPHEGEKITCLADKEKISSEHPNRKMYLDDQELKKIESEIIKTFF